MLGKLSRSPIGLQCAIASMLLASSAGARPQQSAPSIRFDGLQRPTVSVRGRDIPEAYRGSRWTSIPPLDLERLKREDDVADPAPQRIGVVRDLPAVTTHDGDWLPLADGGMLWTRVFRCAGARGMRLRVREWSAELGCELSLYALDGVESRGPIRRSDLARSGELWTPTVHADQVVVECYLPPDSGPLTQSSSLAIDGALVLYRGPGSDETPTGGGGGGNPTACQLDWACHSDWLIQGEGVVALNWIADGIGYFCSGAILNRLPGDFDPLIATATHCGVTSQNVESLEAAWFWEHSSCGGAAPNVADLPTTRGSALLVRDVTTDWTLIGMREDVPGGVTYLGWTTASIPAGRPVVGIHHARGSWKRIAFGAKLSNGGNRPNPNGANTCIAGNAHEISWPSGDGLLEPGSSGSPLFDGFSELVVGVASCASTACPGANTAAYGRFDQAYSILQPFLDPADPVYADADYPGTERGSATEPFDSLREASFAVIAGGEVRLAAGTYSESLRIERPMRLSAVGGQVVIR